MNAREKYNYEKKAYENNYLAKRNKIRNIYTHIKKIGNSKAVATFNKIMGNNYDHVMDKRDLKKLCNNYSKRWRMFD